MLKAILRGLVGVITLPLVIGIYWVVSVGFIVLGAEPTGNFIEAVWGISIAWVIALVIYPIITKLLDKVVA
jgi:hypothetical protein